ncbi:MAG: hypothetical protein ACOX7N_01680 [Lawsonibacter sp.]|jgi:flagellar hook-associated protein 3 FlgL
MVRITTNGVMYNYRSNLSKTTNNLNNAMTKVMTQRNFNDYYADPAGATRAFKIHSSINAIQVQYANNTTVSSKFQSAWSVMKGVLDDLTEELGQVPALKGLNEPNLDALDTQGQILREGAEALVQSMNSRYDQDYIFAGSDNQEPPFDIQDGHITYRGVKLDVDLDQPYTDKNGNQVLKEDGKPMTNQEMLDKWANEDHLYVDVGLGFELDENGKVIDSTAFDAAISGISVLGYGVDEDGDPKNLASIMLRMAEIFEGYTEGAADPWNGNEEEAKRLLNKFNQSKENAIEAHSQLAAQATFLESNGTQLQSTFDSMNTELIDVEMVDPVEAIQQLVWAQTCYSAALQVGANAVPQSLMDYMK